jgi:hypothetical protein
MVTGKLKKIFEPVAMVLIIIGIIGLIQPIKIEAFRWGFNVLWVGLVLYMIFSHFKS